MLVTHQLSFNVPCSTFIFGHFRRELNVRKLDNDLQAPVSIIAFEINGLLELQIHSAWLKVVFHIVWHCTQMKLSWFRLHNTRDTLYPIFSSLTSS